MKTLLASAVLLMSSVASANVALVPAQGIESLNLRGITCYARNARGSVFSAVGLFPGPVQQRALNNCRSNSILPATCRALGCN